MQATDAACPLVSSIILFLAYAAQSIEACSSIACNLILLDPLDLLDITCRWDDVLLCCFLPLYKWRRRSHIAMLATMEQLLNLQPPPHVMPNFVNPPSQRGVNLACNIFCLTVATLCVLIRLHTKIFIQRSPGWDDRKQHPSIIEMYRLNFPRCVLYRLGMSNQYFGREAPTESLHEAWPRHLCFPIAGLESRCWRAPMGYRTQEPPNMDKGEPSVLIFSSMMGSAMMGSAAMVPRNLGFLMVLQQDFLDRRQAIINRLMLMQGW